MANDENAHDGAPFCIGDWLIDPSLGRVSGHTAGRNSESEQTKLEPQVMTVLLCLAKQQGQVVSREDIEAQAWANRVVGYDSLSTAIIKLRKALGDNSKNPRYIETVPKKGYRLIATVTPAKAEVANKADQYAKVDNSNVSKRPEPSRETSKVRLVKQRFQLVIILSVITVGLGLVLYNKLPYLFTEHQDSQHNTIAVLPFKNMSDDIQQEYFSDGITSDLITDLSKISGLGVIARNSVFAYKDSSIDVRQIGKELSVTYVIEGSVRKSNNKVRITARLIDAENGHNIWAERFDGNLGDVFALQDNVTAEIISALKLKLSDREQQQLAKKYTNSIEAYDQFLQGWQLYWEYSKESNTLAKEYFNKAIELDPEFARAYANLALSYAYDVLNGWTSTPEATLKRAQVLSRKALELDNNLAQVRWASGFTAIVSRNHKLALSEALKVIELEPNNADGYGILATTLNYAAKPRDALVQMQKAMRLNPLHPSVYKTIMGEIYFNLHEYDNAIRQFEHALERNPEAQEPRLWLMASYAHLDRKDDASWQLEQIRLDDPDITIATIEPVIPFIDPMQLKHLVDGLNKAGLN
jgi:TolB-like protein/DNA-binding winged helix-turn-helix (wHTH) protein/Flp pilus assembly protein TadD